MSTVSQTSVRRALLRDKSQHEARPGLCPGNMPPDSANWLNFPQTRTTHVVPCLVYDVSHLSCLTAPVIEENSQYARHHNIFQLRGQQHTLS
jgi:hypothetical protein